MIIALSQQRDNGRANAACKHSQLVHSNSGTATLLVWLLKRNASQMQRGQANTVNTQFPLDHCSHRKKLALKQLAAAFKGTQQSLTANIRFLA
jgi:hypothetical protein